MKIFIVGFLILSFGEISKIVSGDYDMTIELRDLKYFFFGRHVRYDFNFGSLDNYNTSFTEHLNLKFKNPVKYFIMDHNDLEKQGKNNKTYGMKYDTISSKYNLIGQWAYHLGYTYTDLNNYISFLNIHMCDSGLMIADKTHRSDMLNDKSKTYYVDYGIVLLLKAENNRIIFNTFFYKGMNFKATACPYTNWVSKYGLLKFIPENHIMENGFFEQKNDKAHIVVPIYPRKNDLNFFVCGTWKQPKVPDIKIGFSLLPDDNGMDHISDVEALESSLTCDGSHKAEKYYHFGYMTEESSFMGEIFMDKIDASISQKYKLYSGSTILYYDKNKIESQVVHTHSMITLGESDIRESPLCIRKLSSNIKAILLPVIGTLDTIKYNEISSIYYSLMKESDLNKKHPVYCLSKVDKDEYYRYDQFYSRAANILVVNTKQKENGSVAIQKEIEFTKTMNGFGKYSCNVTRATPAYKNNLITITNTYFLPADNVVFNLTDIVFNNNHSDNLASCIGKYDDWGKLKFMNIRKQGLNALTISINDFSSSNKNILIKGNKIYLKESFNLTTVEVACTYVTNVNTSFITKQNFKFPFLILPYVPPTTNKPNGGPEDKQKLTMWIGILLVVLIALATIITTIYLMRRKKKRLRKKKLAESISSNTSMSSSASSSVTSSNSMNKSNLSKSKVPINKKVAKGKKVVKGKKITKGKKGKQSSDASTMSTASTSAAPKKFVLVTKK